MKYRQILLETKEKRNQELEEYTSLLDKFTDPKTKSVLRFETDVINVNTSRANRYHEKSQKKIVIEKRKTLLVLELPFETDAVNVNTSRANRYHEKNQNKKKSLEERIDQSFPHNSEKSSTNNHYLKESIKNLINSIRPNITYQSPLYDHNEKRITYDEPCSDEDMACIYVQKEMLREVSDTDIKDTTKKIQQSQIKKTLIWSPQKEIACPKAWIDPEIIANYFSYLESRCLRSYRKEPYIDLIEIRLLLYVPRSSKTLQEITPRHMDIKKNVIKFNEEIFPIPETFIQLVNSLLSLDEPLLKRSGHEIHKFVLRTSQSAKLEKRLTPKLIKSAIDCLCYQEQFFNDQLPRR